MLAARILHPKQVVYGVRLAEGAATVTERALKDHAKIEMETGSVTLNWRRQADGTVVVRRIDNDKFLLAARAAPMS